MKNKVNNPAYKYLPVSFFLLANFRVTVEVFENYFKLSKFNHACLI
jgi:hypothetical protein